MIDGGDIVTEQEELNKSLNFIRQQAWHFIAEQRMEPKGYYFEDVFQEACVGWLLWYRKCNSGEYRSKTPQEFAASAIRYHLLRRFCSRNGYGLSWRQVANIQASGKPLPRNAEETGNESDSFEITEPYVRDFLNHLSALDRSIVVMLMYNEKPGYIMEAMGIPRSTLQYRRKVIRNAYDKYESQEAS